MKALYIITSYKAPEQVARLSGTIRNQTPHSIIMIHHDGRNTTLDPNLFAGISNILILPWSIPVEWGDISMVKMMLGCLNEALNMEMHWDWLFFLTGQDYPIRPLREVEAFLEDTEYDGFLKHFSTDHPTEGKTARDRYDYRYVRLPKHWRVVKLLKKFESLNTSNKFIRIFCGASNAGPRIGFRRSSSMFGPDFVCYKGGPWMTINRKCVQYIVDYLKEKPEILSYYSSTLIPEESILHTILLNNPELKISESNLRYIDWNDEDKAHPEVLTLADYESMIRSGEYFARKFDLSIDSKVLDKLDGHLAQTGKS